MNAREMREGTLRVVLGVVLLAGCGGCIIHGQCVHDPPLARNVRNIVRGQTTKEQVLGYFGIPDLEAQGATVILHDDSMMGRKRHQMKRNLARADEAQDHLNGSLARLNGSRNPQTPSAAALYDERVRLRAYSSIDDEHIAYLYEETDEWYVAGIAYPLAIGGADYRIRWNRLLILINRHTGVVDEFGYRQEFKAR
jgi:hypothetical protein